MRSLLKIYRTPDGKRRAYTLAYYLNGVRRREKFTTKQQAQTRADEVMTALSNGDTEAAGMTGADKASLMRVRELVGDREIENVAAEYAEARTVLDEAGLKNIRLITVAEHYVTTHAQCPEIMVADAIDEMLARKEADECSDCWIHDLEVRLTKFRRHFKCPLLSLSGAEVDRWIQKIKGSLRTKKNYRTAVSTLIQFAKSRGYLPKTWNEMDKVGFREAPPGRIKVWSPDELQALLEFAQTRRNESRVNLVPWIAIRAFAGIRYFEMGRLHWSDIQRETKLIALEAHVTKTCVSRIIPLQPNLAEWLEPYADRTGPIVTYKDMGYAYAALLEAAELPSRHNALRDSYASYRMAQTGYDKFKVAQECGNSPTKLEQSYRALRTPDGTIITPDVAAAYFGIRPKIVTMGRASA